ncbi:MAG: DUF4428 domain-containing protein [Oscillospiraceae bacterium]|nr:DUF4428 domain-containing protein [Oscillospiraceae bacterium]
MGLFDKKYCDFCGGKIGLLGNKKLEDGNMCKDCAAKLSPWFNERRHSTKADIQAQLDYREENRAAVAAFHTTRSLGKYTKVLLDEDAGKLAVTSASDLKSANPDILDCSQVTGCDLDIQESRHELKRTDKDGHSVSYNPPRFEYSYNFYVTIRVNHPFFDEIRYSLSNGYIKTGETAMGGMAGSFRVQRAGVPAIHNIRLNDYNEFLKMGNEIKQTLDRMRTDLRKEINTQKAPKTAVLCPHCGATTIPDANGCCEYCGSTVNA